MRVLHVYAGNLYGGVEAMLATLARCRGAAPEMEPVYALGWDGRLAEELRAAGTAPRALGPARLSRPWTVWRARRRFAALLADERPGVVVFHSAWSHGIFAPVARRAGVPVVFWLHDAVSGDAAEHRARRTRPDLAVCTSAWVAATLPRLFPAVPARVLHPPVQAPPRAARGLREAVRAALGTPRDARVVVQASRMEPWKGHALHLEALARLPLDSGWHCWMLGAARRPHEQRHHAALREQAERLGIARRVQWLGERDDVPRLLAAADLLCQPNLSPEPFGITFVEAMQAELPVLGTDLGGAREVVDATTGVLVPPADPAALAAALADLLADPQRRRALGAAGPARAAALCAPERQLPRLSALLREVAR